MGLSRERLVLPVLVVAAAVVLLVVTVRREEAVARERVLFEDQALAAVRAVAEAERRFHAAEGRYGWAKELEAARLLPGLRLEDRDGHRTVSSPRYRIDVLLAYSLRPGDVVLIATDDQAGKSVELQRLHFAVVARPWSGALTGFRTFYLDDKNEVYVSEGVSDVPSRTRQPLPDALLTRGVPRDVAGLRWWKLNGLPPR